MALEPAPSCPWRTVSSREAYRNPWSVVTEDVLAGPDGRPGLYGYFAGRDAVLVLPLFPDRSTILVRQWRHAYGCSSWELVCGSLEDGEDVAGAAVRELAEEARVEARRWTPLGAFHASDSRVAGRTHGFIAEELAAVDGGLDDSECDLVRQRVPMTEAVAAVLDGRITHVASAYLLLRVARSLGM
jgi:8-oxo-dGTP pyrophosphatase MutT (NUDIX family)